MGCRLVNQSRHPLMLPLRGGETLVLLPGASSPPMREELLYGSPYIAELERTGVLRRTHEQWQRVRAAEEAARPPRRGGRANALADLELIDKKSLAQLGGLGIQSTTDLLARTVLPGGVEALAAAVGVAPEEVAAWSERADLVRLVGVGPDFAQLLVAAGVHSVPQLAAAEPDRLLARLTRINEQQKITKGALGAGTVAAWLEDARLLTRAH